MKLVMDKTPLVSSLWVLLKDKKSWDFPEGTHTWSHREFSTVILEAMDVISDAIEFHVGELNCPKFILRLTPRGFGHPFRYYSGFSGRHTDNILADYMTVFHTSDKGVLQYHIHMSLLLEKHQEVRKGELTGLLADILSMICLCAFEAYKRVGRDDVEIETILNAIFKED